MSLGLGVSIPRTTKGGGGIGPPPATSFVFTVDTTNSGSAADTFVLPLALDGVIDMNVYWGDGDMDNITLWNQPEITHVYSGGPGIYQVSISGTIRGWYFNGGGDKNKILNIERWGDFNFTIKNAFKRCTNLTSTATDTPAVNLTDFAFMFESCPVFNPPNIHLWDMAAVTRINWMFFGCTVFNQPIGSWNTANVYEISYMLYNCLAFDQDISTWNVAAVTNYAGFLTNGTLSTVNYDALLIAWDGQAVSAGETPDFGNSVYTNCSGAAFTARNNLISSDGWTITDGGGTPASCPTPFTFTVDTTKAGSAANTFVVPLVSNGSIDLVIDWGDGGPTNTIIIWNDSNLTHVYAASGTYTIQITATTGTLRGWTFGWAGDKAKMTGISQWGDFNWTNSSAFTQCVNMVNTATDLPNITGNSMQYGFYGCTLWNPANAGSWDVSTVTNLNSLWIFCSSFNQDIDSWDVSNVYDFGGVFYGTAFNQPLPNWDTGSGTSFNQMFNSTPFNQDIGMWDMSSALSIFSMFYDCPSFNQDLNSWDVSNVTNMQSVFTGCTAFNGDISSWNVSSCTNFSGAFQSCSAFNGNITGWNVSAGTNFSYMFRSATSFNQNISVWNVGNATNMNSMFFYANIFDQPIGVWNTGNVTDMRSMLRNNTLPASFDQDISGWDISSVTQLDAFMAGTTISTAHYDALLVGWEAQTVISGVTADFGNSTYSLASAAATARADLIAAPNLWTITDGGGV